MRNEWCVMMAACALLGAAPAWAAPQKGEDLSMPHPVFAPNGAFSYCFLSIPQSQNRILSVARSAHDETNLGLVIPGGNFKRGEHYDLDITIPPAGPRKMRAVAMDENGLLIQLGADQAAFKNMRTAQTLTASASGTTLTFDLAKDAKGLALLEPCVAEGKKKAPPANAKEASKDAFPETLRAILADAGVEALQPLDLSSVPKEKRPADYAWKAGSLLGGVTERMVPKNKKLAELVDLYLAGLKEKCTGPFTKTQSPIQKAPGVDVMTAEALCTAKTGNGARGIVAEIMFYLTDEGRFVAMTHEGQEADKAAAQSIRDKLAAGFVDAARKVGKENTPKSK